jgi:uncharacterized membrane protein
MNLSILVSLLLTACRVIVTGRWSFSRLSWNLLLAYIPFLLSLLFLKLATRANLRKWAIPFFILWFLFLPNTFYLLTDMVHLGEGRGGNYWYDFVLLLSYAINGTALGVMSIRNMEIGLNASGLLQVRWYFSIPVLFLASMGVMIGRVLRYNSWSIVLHMDDLLRDLTAVTIDPEKAVVFWGYTSLCFLVLVSGYWITGRVIVATRQKSG